MKFSIVIPAYNEEEAISGTIEDVLASREKIYQKNPEIDEVECIVVNDGSKDKTAEITKQYSDVRLIDHDVNKGYGAALKTGFNGGSGEILGFLDGDGTCSAEMFADMVRTLIDQQSDIVIGSRMVSKESGMPFTRKIGNRLFAYLLSWIVGQKITDTASGMRVFKKGILPKLYPLPDGLHMTPAMSTQALHEHLKIEEIPIPYDVRTGESKLNAVTDGLRFLRTILGIACLYNPLKFFGIVGMIFLLLGGLLSIKPFLDYFTIGFIPERDIYRFFVIMVFFIIGVNVIHFGGFMNNVLDIIHNREYRRNDFWHRFIFRRSIMSYLDRIGIGMMVISIFLNWETYYQYIFLGNITIHWSLIFISTTLFIIGVQLFMGTFLIKILQELKNRSLNNHY